MDPPDLLHQVLLLLLPRALRARQPRVEAARGHLQKAAQGRHAELLPVLLVVATLLKCAALILDTPVGVWVGVCFYGAGKNS